MLQDFSWDASAHAYANVYRWAVETRTNMNLIDPQCGPGPN
jgi:hypothetical protein